MAQWIAACEADDIDPEDVIPFEHGGSDYAIYRSPEDVYYATDGHCTHEKTLLCDGLVMGGVIECPKHNGRAAAHRIAGVDHRKMTRAQNFIAMNRSRPCACRYFPWIRRYDT